MSLGKFILIILSSSLILSCKSRKLAENSKSETATKTSKSVKAKYAEKLGVDSKDIKNEKLYSFIDEWYGVPYKYAGKDKKGIDCSSLTSTLYLAVYQKSISSNTKSLVDEIKSVKKSELREGDLVFFKIESTKVSHVGVYLLNQKFVHASTKKGVMISDLNEPFFVKTYHSAGRVK
jgi:cell wall-associated NlpC family hydrolase